MSMSGQQAIAEYFRRQADWRAQKAAEYLDDPRNATCVEGLRALAEHTLSLDPDDERIVELEHIGVVDGWYSLPPADSAAKAVSQFRFHDPDDDCDRFLTRLVKLVRDDSLRFAEFAGELEVDGGH